MTPRHPGWGQHDGRPISPLSPGYPEYALLGRGDRRIIVVRGSGHKTLGRSDGRPRTDDLIDELIAKLPAKCCEQCVVTVVVERSCGCGVDDAGGPRPGVSGSLIEPLTPQERVILRQLDSLLGKAEIADALCVSVNTVKTHVKNIYRKLGASRRSDAVSRARDLHLL